ncbi:MAG: cytidylyltransferase domain-containing protein [Phycisphaerales bacterium JB063]
MPDPPVPNPTSHPPALAVVLARAGSKGLPHKNILDVAGKPMLAWTLEHALASTSVDRVLLSTDGEALAAVGRRYPGVEVVPRPDELASDTATVDAAARHALTQTDSTHRAVVILYGNIPVRPADLTDRALAMLHDTGADSVQSVCPVGKHHPYWMKQLGANDELIAYEDNNIYRRQDLPPVYELDGGIIAVTRDALFTTRPGEPHAFLGSDRRAITTEPGDVIDVDSAIDLHVAQAILSHRPTTKRNAG